MEIIITKKRRSFGKYGGRGKYKNENLAPIFFFLRKRK